MEKTVVLNVDELERILNNYHHQECWLKVKEWFAPFGKNLDERSKFLKSILYTEGPLTPSDDFGVGKFSILQGDIVKTKAAVTNAPIFDYSSTDYSFYVVIPSSCSIQPRKYRQVLLARLWPIESLTGDMRDAFLCGIRFDSTKLFYFPPISGVAVGEFGFLGVFEEISYIENQLLQSTSRVASLSLIGWHLLNAFLVHHYTRPSTDDLNLRKQRYDKNWSFMNG